MEIMKKLKLVSLLILLIGCTTETKALDINDNSAGKWKLGMSYSNAVKQYHELNYTLREGRDVEEDYYYRTVNVWAESENQSIATFHLSEDYKILVITIYDPRFVTNKGIAVGSTVEDLIKAYPNNKTIDRGQPILVPDDSKIEFFLPVSLPNAPHGKISGIRVGVEK